MTLAAAQARTGRSPLRQPSGPWELTLGLLALLSVGIFLIPYLDAIHLDVTPAITQNLIIPLDIGICVVFAVDYLVRMGRSGRPALAFARENLFQPFAMIPLSTPVINQVQVLMILIVAARFVRAFNVVFGEQAFQAILRRYSGFLAREITDAVMVRSMATAREVVARGRFAHWVADALDRRRGELHMVVLESLERVPAWETFKRLPGSEELVERSERLAVEALLETMRSERLNILIANIIDDSLEEFKLALEEKHPGVTLDALGPDAAGTTPQRGAPGPLP